MGVSPSLSIGNNFGSMRWKLRLGIVLIWSILQMFSHLGVDSSQSPEGTLNLIFLFATFKRVEKDTYLYQMPTLVHGNNQNKKNCLFVLYVLKNKCKIEYFNFNWITIILWCRVSAQDRCVYQVYLSKNIAINRSLKCTRCFCRIRIKTV